MPARPSRAALALIAGLGLVPACAPVPDSGAVVTLEPMTPRARAARDAALQGPGTGAAPATPAPAAAAAPGALADDATFTGGPVAAAPALGPAPESYEIVPPKPLPDRPASSGPSVVGFALATSHPVGQQVYARQSPSAERAARACARYASPDLAQAAFLRAGGPDSDAQGLDPDGDGYACGWNPVPFRQAVR